MLFNSFEFLLVFLPAAVVVCRLADPYSKMRMAVLIALSLMFYGYWNPRFLILLIFSISSNWLAARAFSDTQRGIIITLAIIGNLAILGYFKYSGFFVMNVEALTGYRPYYWDLALPLGISFFTFHHIMYLVDLKRGKAPTYSLELYSLYICFFPQAISGPIARWDEVIHQFGGRIFAPGYERRCAFGVAFIVIGLVEKVLISDQLAHFLDPIYVQAASEAVTNGQSWMALGFAFQVFFDFAGYSDIAIGLGLIFGVQLPRNFNAPFRATSLIEFWQCWHMTLARFLRDYVFTPISRSGLGGQKFRGARLLVALLLTMMLCGLWHGAGWTYVLWGTSQGLGLMFAAIWRRKLPSPPAVVGWAATVSFFVITVVMFRAPTLVAAWHIYEGLAIAPSISIAGRNSLLIAVFCAIALPASHDIINRLMEYPRAIVASAMAVVAGICVLEIGKGAPVHFIYFQF